MSSFLSGFVMTQGNDPFVSSFYFQYFQVLEGFAVNVKADKGTDLLPALKAGCSGVDKEHIELFVMHDLEYMRMTAYKQVWGIQ